MNQPFTLYGWRISWYSAKIRSYLQHKGIVHVERKPGIYTFKRTIPRRCGGDAAVPVVVTPEGEWLQDSSCIIEQLEQRFATLPALPATPVQRMFSMLVEIWADEFWHAPAEHYRFSFPENYPVWRDELGTLLPGFPRFVRHAVAGHFHQFMLDVTRDVGVLPETIPLIERWTATQLDAMEHHLASMPYLLGTRATLADYAMMGPINGHLAWDPRPAAEVIACRPRLRAWIERMSAPPAQAGQLLHGDAIPATLAPMLASLCTELLPYLEQCAQALVCMTPRSRRDPRYPRFGPPVQIPYGDGSLSRITVPYVLWMVQRLQDQFKLLPESGRATVRTWLDDHGGARLLTLRFPRLRRAGLHVAADGRQDGSAHGGMAAPLAAHL